MTVVVGRVIFDGMLLLSYRTVKVTPDCAVVMSSVT